MTLSVLKDYWLVGLEKLCFVRIEYNQKHSYLTGVSSQGCSTKFLSTETSVTFISNKASLIPTQFLLPIPNGAQAH